MRIDFLRYLILQLFGGVYADIDVQPLRDLSPILQAHSCVLASEPEPFLVSLGFGDAALFASNILMASRPGHPFWGVLMNQIEASHREPLKSAGPIALTEAVREFAAMQTLLPREAAVFLAPSMYFYPPLKAGGDKNHQEMLSSKCLNLMTINWSPFAKRLCKILRQQGKIDWSIPLAHPRSFNHSFTRHLMFNSWNSYAVKFQRYELVDEISFQVTRPDDFLSSLKHSVMSSFDYEKKVLSLKIKLP